MEWCIRNEKPITHLYLAAKTEDNPYVPRQSIDDARRKLPDRLFRQYYLAEFIDDAAVFMGFRNCIEDGDPIFAYEGSNQRWIDPEAGKKEVVIGADWGKLHDYTVFGAFDYTKSPKKLVGVQRFNGISYIEAIKELYYFAREFKRVGLLLHDQTGVGQGVDDMLAQLNLPVQGVTFTNKSKSEMVNQLILGFQKEELSLPNWPQMIKELDAYEVITTPLGNYRYSAPEGSGIHDDIVSMLLLAYSAALEYGGDFSIRFLEDLGDDLKSGKLNLDKWYKDIIEEENDSPFPASFTAR
jgi:phage FluMu gp28-like protein